jgi:hypothetical protein
VVGETAKNIFIRGDGFGQGPVTASADEDNPGQLVLPGFFIPAGGRLFERRIWFWLGKAPGFPPLLVVRIAPFPEQLQLNGTVLFSIAPVIFGKLMI